MHRLLLRHRYDRNRIVTKMVQFPMEKGRMPYKKGRSKQRPYDARTIPLLQTGRALPA